MFEITYNDADALERYEKEKRAYPGAKYDFTFEKRFLVYHADMLHQIIYYAIDVYWWCGAQFTGITWEYRL